MVQSFCECGQWSVLVNSGQVVMWVVSVRAEPVVVNTSSRAAISPELCSPVRAERADQQVSSLPIYVLS